MIEKLERKILKSKAPPFIKKAIIKDLRGEEGVIEDALEGERKRIKISGELLNFIGELAYKEKEVRAILNFMKERGIDKDIKYSYLRIMSEIRLKEKEFREKGKPVFNTEEKLELYKELEKAFDYNIMMSKLFLQKNGLLIKAFYTGLVISSIYFLAKIDAFGNFLLALYTLFLYKESKSALRKANDYFIRATTLDNLIKELVSNFPNRISGKRNVNLAGKN